MTDGKEIKVRTEVLDAPAMVPMAKISGMMTAVDEVVKGVMIKDEDYGTIPGTKKDTLFKSGAEKLAALFGFCAHFELIDKVEDHFKEWPYEADIKEWDEIKKRKVKVGTEMRTAFGFFHYRFRCTLTHRNGTFVADAEGSFSSREKTRESAPANTILKMAQKRAYVAAILLATCSSNRFTQDMEDAPRSAAATQPKSRGKAQAPAKDAGIEFEVASKYENSFCWGCNSKHGAIGDMIVKVKIAEKDDPVWMQKTCYESLILNSGKVTETTMTATDGDPELTDEIVKLEDEKVGDNPATRERMRKEYAGSIALEDCSRQGLLNLRDVLDKMEVQS